MCFLGRALLLLTPSFQCLFTNSVGRVSLPPLGFRGPWSWVGRWSPVRLTVRGSWGGVFFWSLTILPGGMAAQVVGCPPEELFLGFAVPLLVPSLSLLGIGCQCLVRFN